MLIYYFITSLKPVSLFEPPPISRDGFLVSLKDCLDEPVLGDIALLEEAITVAKKNEALRREYWDYLINHARSYFLKDWAQQVFFMYEQVARMLGGQKVSSDLGFLSKALTDSDPLSFEKAQAQYMWRLLDESISHDSFAYDQVLAYFIKLELCERFISFDQQQGEIILKRLTQRVREVAYES